MEVHSFQAQGKNKRAGVNAPCRYFESNQSAQKSNFYLNVTIRLFSV
jgi:hypothetical protein